jgi:hypothetical protein
MASDAQDDEHVLEEHGSPNLESGPFVLRTLLKDVPLPSDGAKDEEVKINCVEYLGARDLQPSA